MKKLASILIALTLILSMFTGFSVSAARAYYVDFFNSNGDWISEITVEKEISAEFQLPHTEEDVSANVIVAHYNKTGAMTEFYVADTFTESYTEENNGWICRKISGIDVSDPVKTHTVKVLVWEDFNSVTPLLAHSDGISRYVPDFDIDLGMTSKGDEIHTTGASAYVPAGVKVKDGTETLTLSVTTVTESQSDITVGETDKLTSLDVHVEGVSPDNTVPIEVTIFDVASKGLNEGNLALYHIENGVTVQMTRVYSYSDLIHNTFLYNPADGTLTLALANFSEIAVVEDTEKAWEGEFDYSWYLNRTGDTYKIANADQFAAFGAIVGGMELPQGILQDTFEGKTVTLVSDINIGDKETENNPDIIFYPIGYYNSTGSYERTNETTVTSNVSSFKGTFDGNGHTISNFYQNTWEMFGDYNDGYSAGSNYYKDAMGLFGYVNGGTVKNLIVENFSSDGEFTPTGVVAAYAAGNATFENISVFNCNPRVYNTGNGGIVGIAGDSTETENTITFKNITVDQSNKISALWGSYDVACGGIMGMFRGYSPVKLENCHVAAIMDVNNDVCANYQYYWYRYSGMFIGSVRRNETDGGYTVAYDDNITATDCTYTMGDWNEYWYCEIVANSLASYTHDHQFSRLTTIGSLSEIQDANGNWAKAGHFVIPRSKNSGDAECFHIMKNSEGTLYRHFHDKADESNPDIYETKDINGDGELNDLKEDRQCYYMPFHQMFNGNGYGVKPTYEYTGMNPSTEQIEFSSEKFASNGVTEIIYDYGTNEKTVSVGDLFAPIDGKHISSPGTFVYVSPVADSEVSATFTQDVNDWFNSTLTFTGKGTATVTITDYYYCTPTTITVNVAEEELQPVNKFKAKENLNFTRETEGEAVVIKIGDIFDVIDESLVFASDVKVTVTGEGVELNENTENWETGTLTFAGEGTATVTITDGELCVPANATVTVVNPNAVEKFTANSFSHKLVIGENSVTTTLGKIFTAKENDLINSSKITVSGAEVVTKNDVDWTQTTIKITDVGTHSVTISDNNFCVPATATVTVIEPDYVQKFAKKFNNESFTYRVGNVGEVTLGTLFEQADANVPFGNISVTVETMNDTAATGTPASASYTAANWTNGKIKFNNTGIVKVTITDNLYCTPTELYLEVVDAVNATTATSATANNVVLLNDASFSSLEVSGGYTLFGNGFTLTCGSDSYAADFGYSFVTLTNGTLDNVQIICPNFDYAALYKSNLTSSDNRSYTDSAGKTRYYNARSGVMASGNSRILNSRISGGRASVNISGGDVVIDNSSIERGAVASILVGAANSVTLKDVTLVQMPTASTYYPDKLLMGFSVLLVCDSTGKAAPVTLEGDFVQYAWVDESDKQYVPSDGQSVVTTALKQTDYLHDLDGDGKNESLNLGFAYMPESMDLTSKVTGTDIEDNRTNKSEIPYDSATVSVSIITTYVYSYKNTNGTDNSYKTQPVFTPNKYGDIISVLYNDTQDGLEADKSAGIDGWIYELNVDLDKLPGYVLDFSKLTMTVNGITYNNYTVDGGSKPTSPVAVTAGGTTYTLVATADNGKTYTTYFKVTGTETSKESPSLVASNYAAGVCVASSKGGTWHGAAPALEGIQVKYWSVAEKQYKTINLADYTPETTGKLNGSNTTWTYSPDNGDFTLTLTGGQVHSGNNVYAVPVCVDTNSSGTADTLYFVAATSNGLVNSGNSARTIPVSYSFKDNNNGTPLTFSNTWSVAEDKDSEYSYSDFCNGKMTKLESSSSTTCLAEGTLITMADGSKRAVEDLRKGDSVMAFDHLTGEITKNDVIIVVRTESEHYENTFVFDDGSELATINEHGIYDLDLNKYVNIDHENFSEYVGHRFVSVDTNGTIGVKKLMDVESVYTSGYKYDIVTDKTLNYVAEDTLSVTHVLVDVINSFDFAEDMKYDASAMAEDIEKYGLYTYDEWDEYCDISVFEQYNIPVMKVGISKGLYTKEYIIGLINTYVLDDSVQIID